MLKIKSFTFNPFAENTYVLYNEKGDACILDPGCSNPKEEALLVDFISKHKLNVSRLIQTHAHIDHVLGTAFISKQFDILPELHPEEVVVYNSAASTASMYGLTLNPLPKYQELKEERLILGEDELELRFVPGHSPGHIALINHEGRFVIGGDVLFQGSIGRTDLPGGDFSTLEHSIQTQLYPLPDEFIVYSGHGPETSIGYEKQHNPFVRS